VTASGHPPKASAVLTHSFSIESAKLCVLELKLTNFGSRESLTFRCDTEGVEIRATEIVATDRARSPAATETNVLIALHWRVRPSIARLICRSDKTTAAIGISNFATSSLPQFIVGADAHSLLALASMLRPVGPELIAAHASVLDRMRNLARREFFLNWLPAAEDRFVCLVLLAAVDDPAGFRLKPLNGTGAAAEWLRPVSYSTADNYVVLVFDVKGVMTVPSAPLELAAVIQQKLHVWRLEPGSKSTKSSRLEADQPNAISSRWTDRLCETIAMARADLLSHVQWDISESSRTTNFKLQAEIDNPILVVTDVADMFSLTLVMAAAEHWKTRFARIFLLLPPPGATTNSLESDPLALIEEFGGTGVIEPITLDDLNSIVRELEPGVSLSFTSAAAPYNTPIDEGARTEFPMATFDIKSQEQLQSLRRIVYYSILAGGPMVWRELQRNFSAGASEPISLISEGKTASLVDDLYMTRCARFGWPLGALQHFDRQMFTTFRSGDFA